MMRKLKSNASKHSFISFQGGYLYFNSALRGQIQDLYGQVYGCDVYIDEQEHLIRVEFNDESGEYVLSDNSSGGNGYKVSFSLTDSLGIIRKHYDNIVFGENYIEFEYEVN